MAKPLFNLRTEHILKITFKKYHITEQLANLYKQGVQKMNVILNGILSSLTSQRWKQNVCAFLKSCDMRERRIWLIKALIIPTDIGFNSLNKVQLAVSWSAL